MIKCDLEIQKNKHKTTKKTKKKERIYRFDRKKWISVIGLYSKKYIIWKKKRPFFICH